MQRAAVWISFDLGVRGDYEGMYAWLDTHNAKECGDINVRVNCLATFNRADFVDLCQKRRIALI
jgi:hypothetical protein